MRFAQNQSSAAVKPAPHRATAERRGACTGAVLSAVYQAPDGATDSPTQHGRSASDGLTKQAIKCGQAVAYICAWLARPASDTASAYIKRGER